MTPERDPITTESDLELEDISLNVGGRWALERLSLAFRPGEVTSLSGPSGSGKTTLLSIAGGIVKPTTGFASYGGQHMWQGDGDPRHAVAFVLQVYGLVPILSARENVAIALRARGVSPAEADERPTRSSPASTSATSATARSRSCPVVRCSASPVRGRSRCRPRSCSPTSRPASSTRATAST